MDHIGIDVHKRESQIYIFAEGGEVIEHRIRTEPERFAAVLGSRPRARVLIEASTECRGIHCGHRRQGQRRWRGESGQYDGLRKGRTGGRQARRPFSRARGTKHGSISEIPAEQPTPPRDRREKGDPSFSRRERAQGVNEPCLGL
jgi:hypothetical protein